MESQKRCSKCGATKPLSEFYKRANRPSGLTPWCGECLRELRRRNHSQKRDDPVFKRAACERARTWREANPERSRALDHAKYVANAVAYKARSSARRARVREVRVEPVSRAYVYARDGGICHLCGKHVAREVFHLDHLVPLSKGGEHSHLNLRVAHPTCNLRRLDGRLPAQLLLIG